MNNRKSFSSKVKREVFDKLADYSANNDQKKLDFRNRVIHWSEYGNPKSKLGWNIDHIDHNKENNNLENLRAVHYDTHNELNDEFDAKFKDNPSEV